MRTSLADDYGAQELWQTNSWAGSNQQVDIDLDNDDNEETGLFSSRPGLAGGSQAGISAAQKSALPGRQGSTVPVSTAGDIPKSDDQPAASGLTPGSRAVPQLSASGQAVPDGTSSTASSKFSRPGSPSSQASLAWPSALSAPSRPEGLSQSSTAAGTLGRVGEAVSQPVKSSGNAKLPSSWTDQRGELDGPEIFGRLGASPSQASPGQSSRSSGASSRQSSSARDPGFQAGKLLTDRDATTPSRPGLKASIAGLSNSLQDESVGGTSAAGISLSHGQQPSSMKGIQQTPVLSGLQNAEDIRGSPPSPLGTPLKQTQMLSFLQDTKAQQQSLSREADKADLALARSTVQPRSSLSTNDAQQASGKKGSLSDKFSRQSLPVARTYPALDLVSDEADAGSFADSSLQQQSSKKAPMGSLQSGQPHQSAMSRTYPAMELETESNTAGNLRGSTVQRQPSGKASSASAELPDQQAAQTSRAYPSLDLVTARGQPNAAETYRQGPQDALQSGQRGQQPSARSYPGIPMRGNLSSSDDLLAGSQQPTSKAGSASERGRPQTQAQPTARTYPSMSLVPHPRNADASSTLQQPSSVSTSGSTTGKSPAGRQTGLSSEGLQSAADEPDSSLTSLSRSREAHQSPAKQQQSAGTLRPLDQQVPASARLVDSSAGLPQQRTYPEVQLKSGKQSGSSRLQSSPAASGQRVDVTNKLARQQATADIDLDDDEEDVLPGTPPAPVSYTTQRSARQESLAAEGLTPLAQRLTQTPARDAAVEYKEAEARQHGETSLANLDQLLLSTPKQSRKTMPAVPLQPSLSDRDNAVSDGADPDVQMPGKSR